MAEDLYNPFTPYHFMRYDESDDSLFYQEPRLVVHIDDQAIAVIGELFLEVFSHPGAVGGHTREEGEPGVPGGKVILDLMSSWRSHWPKGLLKARLVGLGLNAVEMLENPELDNSIVHDLNKELPLPYDDGTFDGVIITVSIQYVTGPVELFRDVNRILKPGGLFLVIFSNRMFFTKAVRVWIESDDEHRMGLVASYFQFAGNYEEISGTCRNPYRSPYEDPVYVVMARKAAP